MSAPRTVIPVLAIAAALLAAPQPAAAIPGLERVQGDSLFNRGEPLKLAVAKCPPGKVVVGAGAEVLDGERTSVRLIAVRPNKSEDPSKWGGSVTAVAESANRTQLYDWSLRAYAVCAYAGALDRYWIARDASALSSSTFKETSARCPDYTHTYGAGAVVQTGDNWGTRGKAWLQLIRTTGPLDGSRATGRELPGFDGNWQLYSYAICAVWQNQLFADGSLAAGSEASDRCLFGYTHGIGGGGGLWDGGPIWLDEIKPHADLQGVDVSLTGALDPSIGGMVAHQTCAW